MGGAILAGRLITGWLFDRYFAPRVAFGLLMEAALGTFLLSGARIAKHGHGRRRLDRIRHGWRSGCDSLSYLVAKYFGLRAFSTLYALTWTAYAIAARSVR